MLIMTDGTRKDTIALKRVVFFNWSRDVWVELLWVFPAVVHWFPSTYFLTLGHHVCKSAGGHGLFSTYHKVCGKLPTCSQ